MPMNINNKIYIALFWIRCTSINCNSRVVWRWLLRCYSFPLGLPTADLVTRVRNVGDQFINEAIFQAVISNATSVHSTHRITIDSVAPGSCCGGGSGHVEAAAYHRSKTRTWVATAVTRIELRRWQSYDELCGCCNNMLCGKVVGGGGAVSELLKTQKSALMICGQYKHHRRLLW